MASVIGIDNAIGWAHWQLRGGWKRTLWGCLVLAIFLSGLIVASVRLNPRYSRQVLDSWRIGLLWIQAGLLLLFAGSRISAAIRSDLTTRMIESHRLMPIRPLVAVSGYLWGPTLLPASLAAMTFLIGLIVTIASGADLSLWVVPNLILATFAFFCWVAVAFASLQAKGAVGLLFLPVIALGPTEGAVMVTLPGLMLLLSPLLGRTIFDSRLPSAELTWAHVASLAAQAYIGAVLYVGAARKYRRSEDTALGILPGMLLLAGWVAISMLAIYAWEQFRPRWLQYFPGGLFDPMMMLGSLFASMLVALAPLANAARDRRWTAFSPLVALACAGVCSALVIWPTEQSSPVRPFALWGTVAILAAFMLSLCYLLRMVYRITDHGWVMATIWIFLLNLLPILVDLGRWSASQSGSDYEISEISAFSPIFALIMIWSDSNASVLKGVGFQVGVAAALGTVFYLSGRRRRPA